MTGGQRGSSQTSTTAALQPSPDGGQIQCTLHPAAAPGSDAAPALLHPTTRLEQQADAMHASSHAHVVTKE